MHSRKAIESSNSIAPSLLYWTVLLVLRDIQRHYHFQKCLWKFTFVLLTIFGIFFGGGESGYAETSSATQEDTFSLNVKSNSWSKLNSEKSSSESNKAANANPTTREIARTANLADNLESLKAEFGEGPSGGIHCINYNTDRQRPSGSGLPDYFCVWPERDYLQAQITISEVNHSLSPQRFYVYIMIVWPNQENLIFRKYSGFDLNQAKTHNFQAEDFPLLKEVCAKFSIWEQKLKNEGIVDPFEKEMSGDYCFVWKDSKAMLAKKIEMMQGLELQLVAKSDQISDIQFVINNFQSMLTSIDNFNVKNKSQKKSFEKNINKLLE